MLLAGYGLLSFWAMASMLRRHRSGFWLNAVFVGLSQVAVVYGLIVPGHLGGANGYLGPALYVLAVAASAIGLALSGARASRLPTPRGQRRSAT
jgi:hypothetical protein